LGRRVLCRSLWHENAFAILLSGIKLTAFSFSGLALALMMLARKVEPKGMKIF
jgi:hypothetical protein